MKIERLDLLAFGPFTGAQLDLRSELALALQKLEPRRSRIVLAQKQSDAGLSQWRQDWAQAARLDRRSGPRYRARQRGLNVAAEQKKC